jgi:hypothetical protein
VESLELELGLAQDYIETFLFNSLEAGLPHHKHQSLLIPSILSILSILFVNPFCSHEALALTY